MKITQKQLLMLFEIVVNSAQMVNPMAFSQEDRKKLVNEIINQQDNEILIDSKK